MLPTLEGSLALTGAGMVSDEQPDSFGSTRAGLRAAFYCLSRQCCSHLWSLTIAVESKQTDSACRSGDVKLRQGPTVGSDSLTPSVVGRRN